MSVESVAKRLAVENTDLTVEPTKLAQREAINIPIEREPIFAVRTSHEVNEDALTPVEFEEFDEAEDERVEHPEQKPDFPPIKKGLFYAGMASLILIPGTLALSPFPLLPMLAVPVAGPIFGAVIELPALVLLTLAVGKEHAKWTIKSFYRKLKIKARQFCVGLFDSEEPVEAVESGFKWMGSKIKRIWPWGRGKKEVQKSDTEGE